MMAVAGVGAAVRTELDDGGAEEFASFIQHTRAVEGRAHMHAHMPASTRACRLRRPVRANALIAWSHIHIEANKRRASTCVYAWLPACRACMPLRLHVCVPPCLHAMHA
eukprot:1495726-Alexandrium_andersonii.AAC.1